MKKRSTVFFELEAQSNFLKNIASIDQMITTNSFTPSQNRLLKLGGKNKHNSPDSKGISVEDLNFDAKKYGDEFNQSKYVTIKKHKISIADDSPLKDSSASLKKTLGKLSIQNNETKRRSILLNKIDEDNVDYEVFDNTIKTIMKNHIKYQVNCLFFFRFRKKNTN